MPEHSANAGSSARRASATRPDVIDGLNRLYSAGGGRDVGERRRLPLPRSPRVVAGAMAAVVVIGGATFGFMVTRSSLAVEGIEEGQVLMRRDLAALALEVDGSDDVTVELNGTDVPVTEQNGALIADPEALREALATGANTIVVSRSGRFGLGGATVERSFTYEPGGPRLMVPAQVGAPSGPEAVIVRGLVDDATSLTANGQPVVLEPGGAFTVPVPPGTTEVALVAADADGNQESVTVAVTAQPTPSDYPATAAVHVTARSWADPVIRQQILDLAKAGRINAVQLDIKDEGGEVGYASEVPLAQSSGASMGHYDARAALDELHALDVRVIGRIVCFLDPLLATFAWEYDRSDMIVLHGAGGPLPTDYGTAAFTNVGSPEVRQYHIDLAVEAATLGFDDILYDYVRRPEGDTASMYFPGLETSADVAVARFVVDTNAALAATDATLGVSVFGIAATRPEQIAQDIRLLAPHVDYVAPMVYPSHWGAGEYDVADPLRQPGAIVAASVADFQRVVAGSGAAVVPWLQDFSAGGMTYGPVEVRAQIDAALAAGSPGFILWNSGSAYTVDALAPPAP